MGLETAVAAPAVAKGAETALGGGAAKGAEAAGASALGAGAEAAGASIPLDLLSGGAAAGSAIPAGVGSIMPATGALASGLATEPAFASSLGGAFAPGLDTSAAGLGFSGGDVTLPSGARPTAFSGGSNALDNVAAGSTPSGAPMSAAPNASSTAGLPGTASPLNLDPTSTAASAAKPAAEAGGKGVLDSLGIKNPLGAAIGAGGLAYSMSQGQKPPKFSPEMEASARRLDANGQQLMSYLQSGNLPPGLKASLDQATAGAKAKIISNFAAQGMNTDPSQNTALAQQLAMVDQQAIISTAQMGQQLMASGIAESGLSSDLYKTLAQIDQTQTANIGKSIAAFASAVSGTGGGLQLKLG